MTTIAQIQRTVARHYGIQPLEMISHDRHRHVARPRQIAMYLSRQLTFYSLPQIGRKFGGRDHTTVLHGFRQIEKLRESDPLVRDDLDALMEELRA